jgi:hypothetical protein
MMRKSSYLFRFAVFTMILLISSCKGGAQQYYDTGISDEEYVSIARGHDDAKAFLERYPQAEIYVDRSGRLAVDFRATTRPVTRTTQRWKGIRLRVFIDPRRNRPTDTLFQCNDKIVEKNVRLHLEQYFSTGSCS